MHDCYAIRARSRRWPTLGRVRSAKSMDAKRRVGTALSSQGECEAFVRRSDRSEAQEPRSGLTATSRCGRAGASEDVSMPKQRSWGRGSKKSGRVGCRPNGRSLDCRHRSEATAGLKSLSAGTGRELPLARSAEAAKPPRGGDPERFSVVDAFRRSPQAERRP